LVLIQIKFREILSFFYPFVLQIKIKNDHKSHSIPLEDIGFLVLENNRITLSAHLIEELVSRNVATIFSNKNYMPVGMVLPLSGHQLQQEVSAHQINASLPLKKQLWAQTIRHKLKNQAHVLKILGANPNYINERINSVKSGDNTNEEAKAARYYWKQLFQTDFTRERYGSPPNNYLNYGYAILRSAIARALTGSGLLPTFGIHHHNRYNAYCLADDIMEPYRPFVDLLVYDTMSKFPNEAELTKEIKSCLLTVPVLDVKMGAEKSTLLVSSHETAASLSKCFRGETKKIKYPDLCI